MTATSANNPTTIPYFGQWESPDLIEQFILNPASVATDPCWAQSGARDIEEYVRWSRHLCGMACLKMILAAKQQTVYPLSELMRYALQAKAYVELPDYHGERSNNSDIKGLIYAPFVAMIEAKFGLSGEVITGISAKDIPTLMTRADYFLASVHPSIRTPHEEPPKRGGHLVLITRVENMDNSDPPHIVFHNPSGLNHSSQRDVRFSPEAFDRFFAGRGVLVGGV